MRLGSQSSDVKPGTLAHGIYGNVVTERHRHRYEANEHYLERLQAAGLVISAITQRDKLTEIVELPQAVHPWFVGVQFHPEFKQHAVGRAPAVHQLRAGGAGAQGGARRRRSREGGSMKADRR